MKFECAFELKAETLPIDYRCCILSFIKKCLSTANEGKYFDDYYGPAKDKPFCFSVVFGNPTFTKDSITVHEKRMKLIISTADTRTGFILFSAVAAYKGKQFNLPCENSMRLMRIRQLNEQTVTGNSILIKMLEPLCIRSHNRDNNRDWYYSCKQKDDFEREASNVIKNQLLQAGFSEDTSIVKISPINAKTIVVKHYSINIECSIGEFMLHGDRKALDYLLKSGMGSRKSSGFGVAQLIAVVDE